MNKSNFFIKKLLSAGLLLSVFTQTVLALEIPSTNQFKCISRFEDVEENTPSCYYVNFLHSNGVISGYSDGTYKPEEYVSRAAMAKYISRAFDFYTYISPEDREEEIFTDVQDEHIFYSSINSLKEHQIINGYSDGNYKPENFITRGQAAKIIANSIEKVTNKSLPITDLATFDDVDETNGFRDYILQIYTLSKQEDPLDQITRTNHNLFNPEEPITRKQLSKMVANAMMISNMPLASRSLPLSEINNEIYRDEYDRKDNVKFYRYNDFGINVVKTRTNFEFIYNKTDLLPISQIATENNFVHAINGSYFGAQIRQRPLRDTLDANKEYVMVEGTGSSLRVRSYTSTDSTTNIVGELYDGDLVEKLGEEAEWFKILFENRTRWVSKEFSRTVDINTEMQDYWEYDHAGFLNYYGEHLAPVKQLHEDSQVTHIVKLDTQSYEVKILDIKNFTPQKAGFERYLEFQTGPLLIKDGILTREFIENSKNGNIKRTRNIMVIENDKRTKYFIQSRVPYTYYELLNLVLNMDVLDSGNLTIISLDGGSSVSSYSPSLNEYNFMEEKRVPIVIGLK